MSLSKERLQELIRKAREAQNLPPVTMVVETELVPKSVQQVVKQALEIPTPSEVSATGPTHAQIDKFEWNPEQLNAHQLAIDGKSFCLIGAAGTGKTTTLRELASRLVADNKIPPISFGTKYLQKGAPGIVFTSFTRRAVRNLKKVLSADLAIHCVTLHKLLEYEPMFYDVWDEVQQKNRTTMRFEPARNKLTKLPDTLIYVVVDESSMVSTELFAKLLEALPNHHNVRFIFVGDLHQLPPVYGSAILGFKLLELPVVELTRIYRQAAESPIIALAHKIKNGEEIPVTQKTVTETSQGKVTIHPWKKAISDFDATHTASIFLRKLVLEGDYNEEEDVILCPQEKTKNTAFGTNEFNRVVAQALGEKRELCDDTGTPTGKIGAEVHEIIAGFARHYYAVGDRILVGREDAVIKKISKNAKYWGKRPRPASKELDRWGNYKVKVQEEAEDPDFDVDAYLASFSLEAPDKESDEDRKQEASHLIDVELLDSGATETLTSAGEINGAQFAYCLTVHKSQGSEWNRVFFLTHQSHVVMWNRELLYTAATRARKELYCIVEPDRGAKKGTLWKAAISPRIKGDTLTEKAEFFKGKAEEWQERLEEINALPRGQGTIVPKKFEGETEVRAAPTIQAQPKPVKLVRLSQYVPEHFKIAAEEKLRECWTKAKMIWGAEKIGEMPTLSYDLQREKTIGLAVYAENTIYLNAMWCIAACSDPKLWHEMTDDTIPHEAAHFVNQRYTGGKGKSHDGGWVMAAKLLGMPNPQATASEWPSWAEHYSSVVLTAKLGLFEKVKERDGEDAVPDFTEDTETKEGSY